MNEARHHMGILLLSGILLLLRFCYLKDFITLYSFFSLCAQKGEQGRVQRRYFRMASKVSS
jgi:hypothetical protein